MWYFSWILGVSLACSFGILNAMWYELKSPSEDGTSTQSGPAQGEAGLDPPGR